MKTTEWFRRTTWFQEDERAFFERLARSRSEFHKAQYLRIQALSLFSTRDEALVPVALRLLDRLSTEFPDPSQLEGAHCLAAECHERLGNVESAVNEFRLALAARSRGLDYGTALAFPWYIVNHELTSLYEEALSTLNTLRPAQLAFPVQRFKAATVRAFVAEHRRDREAASRHAHDALEAAGLRESPFRYHRGLGLVGDEYKPILKRLRRLIAA